MKRVKDPKLLPFQLSFSPDVKELTKRQKYRIKVIEESIRKDREAWLNYSTGRNENDDPISENEKDKDNEDPTNRRHTR